MELDGGVAAFASMFSNVRDGRPLKLVDAQQATSKIITRVGQDGLSTWLDEVRRYHEGTFQHCLLVTGIAVAFGLDVGFSGGDVSRLGMAATLHDIGKARIPLAILDKPGRLDPEEEEIIKRHPAIGYDLLKGVRASARKSSTACGIITNISMGPAIRTGCPARRFPIW